MRIVVVSVACVVLVAGCGTSSDVVSGAPPASPYSGPMHLKQDFADEATVLARSGAAGRALECSGTPYDGGGGDYSDGLESVQDSPEKALHDWMDNEGREVPDTGYRVERDDGDRVLLSYDVGERTKVAFIAADGIRDYNDDKGWGIESFAECDPAELPAPVTNALGIDVWEDTSGRRVPVTKIHSRQGPEHCNWQDITFLTLGPDDQANQFLRDPRGELGDLSKTSYDGSATLPDDATDTGFRRGGRQLWLGADGDAAFLVSLKDTNDVERWPAASQPIGCA